MELTAKKAVELSIELWEWLAETGAEFKHGWEGWKRNGGQYPSAYHDCFLCESSERFNVERSGKDEECPSCPYYNKYGFCDEDNRLYGEWRGADNTESRKKYAKQFLGQLKTILKEMGNDNS